MGSGHGTTPSRTRRPIAGAWYHRPRTSSDEEHFMAQDLRSYLDLLKRRRPDELLIVSKPIDPAYEITAFVVKLEQEARRRPVLVFENVKGTRFPVLTNLHASRARLALALGAAPDP